MKKKRDRKKEKQKAATKKECQDRLEGYGFLLSLDTPQGIRSGCWFFYYSLKNWLYFPTNHWRKYKEN